MQYTAGQLVRLAKREKNSARPYLFVNPLQGKHIPTSPDAAIGMCQQAADLVNQAYPDDMLYVIGFAETATGIAASVGSFLRNIVYYQNTTRETNGEDCLLFSEVHSHATDQLLRTAGIETALKSVDRIIFIDDEVTTGNTICNLIRMIGTRFHADHLKYTILSVLNSMSDDRFAEISRQGIDCLFLCRIPYEYEKDSIMDVSFDPGVHIAVSGDHPSVRPELIHSCPVNSRSLVRYSDYIQSVRSFAEEIRLRLLSGGAGYDSVLVLGTEEFMFPTFMAGEMIRQQGYSKNVVIHSTTRSPIIASGKSGYPLNFRYTIRSPYDSGRITYVYNLRKYDRVFVLTDADDRSPGLGDLRRALEMAGNSDISFVRWKYGNQKESV